jgi:hypothetical protein
MAVENRLPEPTVLTDALNNPIAHFWGENLPLLKAFVESSSAPWKPVADFLQAR